MSKIEVSEKDTEPTAHLSTLNNHATMNSIRQIQRLNDLELEKCTPPNASWHTDYRDTAYIHIGGLPFDLSEGDVLTIFSQYGNPVHINLVRDKDTGKSRGFAFLKYEDQKSCDLAVDNLSGASVLGRMLAVDHARYKMKEGERETVGDDVEDEGNETDKEGDGRRKRRRTESASSREERPVIKEEVELARLMREHDDDDPMKAYLVKEKKAEIEEALKAVAISKPKKKSRDEDDERRHRHRHRHHRSRRDDEDGGNDQRRSNGHTSRRRDKTGDEEDRDLNSRSHRSRREHSVTPSGSDEDDRDRRKRSSKRERSDSKDEHRRRRKEDEPRRRRRDDS